jgi:replication factor A1
VIYTVRALEDDAKGVTIRLRVLTKYEPRTVKTRDGEAHQVVDALVGDGTGLITLALWDEKADMLDEGDVIDIDEGYVNRFKGRLRLNVGKFGRLSRVESEEFPSAEQIMKAVRRYRARRRARL